MSSANNVSRFRYTSAMTTKPLAATGAAGDRHAAQHWFAAPLKQATETGIDKHALQMLVHRGTLARAAYGVYRFLNIRSGSTDNLMLAVLWTRVPEGRCRTRPLSDWLRHDRREPQPDPPHRRQAATLPTCSPPPPRRPLRGPGTLGRLGWWQEIPTVTPATPIAQCLAYGTPTYLLRQAIERGHGAGLPQGSRARRADLRAGGR